VIKKPRERGGYRPRWAAEPQKIIINNKLHLKQSSFARIKSHSQLHFAHLQITSRGPKKDIIYLLILGENLYDICLMKGRQLTMDVNGYDPIHAFIAMHNCF
jgi:hypothetical protein